MIIFLGNPHSNVVERMFMKNMVIWKEIFNVGTVLKCFLNT